MWADKPLKGKEGDIVGKCSTLSFTFEQKKIFIEFHYESDANKEMFLTSEEIFPGCLGEIFWLLVKDICDLPCREDHCGIFLFLCVWVCVPSRFCLHRCHKDIKTKNHLQLSPMLTNTLTQFIVQIFLLNLCHTPNVFLLITFIIIFLEFLVIL